VIRQQSQHVRDTSDLPDRLDRVSLIVKEESGQLERRIAAATERLLRRAGQRLRLSGEHTVVALAGGTGSGKSSLFNALAGLELSQVGIRRPTTTAPYACVWGAENVAGLLDWLEVPHDRRIGRESELDADSEVALRGLVLLDLPDHDSVEATHRLEVDRLIDLVDVLVWVLDPQKYADAVVHERYLRPLRSYSDVMMVVLNQADRLDPGQAQSCLQDLRRMLSDDGLSGIRTMLTSARSGVGVSDLRAVLTTAVASHQATARRISADLDGLSGRLGQLARPDIELSVVDPLAGPATASLIALAGIDRLAALRAADYRTRGLRRTGWPLAAWRHRRDEGTPPLAVLRSEVDEVARSVASLATEGLPTGWQQRVEHAAVVAAAPLADDLDAAVHAEAQAPIPASRWWHMAMVVNWLPLLIVGAGAGWAVTTYLRADEITTSVLIGGAVAGGALVLGLFCAAVFEKLVNRGAESRQRRIESHLHAEVAATTENQLLGALRAELTTYNTLQQALRSFVPPPSQADPSTERPPDPVPDPRAAVVLRKLVKVVLSKMDEAS